MIPELGNFALGLSLILACLLAVLPLLGATKNITNLTALARPLTWALFLSLSISFATLF